MTQKSTRLIVGGLFFGILLFTYWLLEFYRPIPGAFEFVMLCVVIAGCGVASLYLAYIHYQSAAIASEMEHGQRPVHGQPVGIYGTLKPMQQPLTSPIAQAPCVLYYFKVTPGGGASQHQLAEPLYRFDKTICVSSVMAPCYVETDYGPIQLLGFPSGGKDLPTHKATTTEQFLRVQQQIESTHYEKADQPWQETMNQVFEPRHVRDDGSMQWHVHLHGSLEKIFPDPIDPDNAWKQLPCIAEVHIPVDIPVCAYGIFDEDRQAIHSNEHQTFITLLATTPQELRQSATMRMWRYLTLGIVALVGVHVAILFAVLTQQNPIMPLLELLQRAP